MSYNPVYLSSNKLRRTPGVIIFPWALDLFIPKGTEATSHVFSVDYIYTQVLPLLWSGLLLDTSEVSLAKVVRL